MIPKTDRLSEDDEDVSESPCAGGNPKTAPKGESGWDAYLEWNTLWLGGKAQLEIEGKTVDASKRIEVMLKPDEQAVLRFTPVKKGNYELGCHLPGHYEAGMRGSVVVR